MVAGGVEVNDAGFGDELLRCSLFVVVDFWAPWYVLRHTAALTTEFVPRSKVESMLQ